MEELCPLCMKQGLKKKMKAFQINLEEAVWLCESEKCTWPMQYKELEYIPRKVGESWSCYWHKYKPERPAVTTSQTEWECFFTPPYTPQTQVSPTAYSDTSSHCSNGINNLYNTYSNEPVTSSSNSAPDNRMDTEENIGAVLANNISELLSTPDDNELMDISTAEDLNLFSPDRLETSSLKLTELKTETPVNSERNLDSVTLTSNLKHKDTAVPTIVKIEKTKRFTISINNNQQLPQNNSVSKSGSQETHKNRISNTLLTEKISNGNSVENPSPQKLVLLPKTKNIQSNNSIKIDDKINNSSSVKVTTLEIDGLPPVTLTYELPMSLKEPNNVEIKKGEEEKSKTDIVVSKNIEVEKCVQSPFKKKVITSKMFEKFSFSELRKAKSLQNNSPNKAQVSNSIHKFLDIQKPVLSIKEDNLISETKNPESVLEFKPKCMNHNLPEIIKTDSSSSHNSQSFELSKQTNDGNMSPDSDNSKVNVNNDLDSILNDFIKETETDMNESLMNDDDWLSSLLV